MKKPTVFPRSKALKATRLAYQGKLTELSSFLQETIDSNPDSAWGLAFVKFNKWLEDIAANDLPYKVFAKGNGKLPFWAYSASPLVTCPGKGDCAKWCYSLKAWRYPAPLLRQIMNTILIRFQSERIGAEFMKLKQNADVRLYVDGDFDSLDTMVFWFDLLKARPDLKVYGYSKSWELFLEYDKLGYTFPENYELNQSSGSKYENIGHIRAAIKKLPIYRGEFVAIDAGKNPAPRMVGQLARKLGMKKVFACPGQCGDCIKKQGKNMHACGSELMKDVTIVIGTH